MLRYVKHDVLLLADILAEVRRTYKKAVGLDLLRYLTLPQASLDACLLLTGVELDLIHDRDMYEEIESNLRGGLVQANTHHQKFDSGETFGLFADINNLYGTNLGISTKKNFQSTTFCGHPCSTQEFETRRLDRFNHALFLTQ